MIKKAVLREKIIDNAFELTHTLDFTNEEVLVILDALKDGPDLHTIPTKNPTWPFDGFTSRRMIDINPTVITSDDTFKVHPESEPIYSETEKFNAGLSRTPEPFK